MSHADKGVRLYLFWSILRVNTLNILIAVYVMYVAYGVLNSYELT